MNTTVDDLQHYFTTNQPDLFLKHVDEVLRQLKETNDFERYIHCALNKAAMYFHIQNFSMASIVLSELSPIFGEHATILQKIRYYNTLAAIQGETKNMPLLFQYLSLAQHLAEKIHAHEQLVPIYQNLSMYYYEMADYDTSWLFAQKCQAYQQTRQNVPNRVKMQLHLIKLHIHFNQFQEATQLIAIQKAQFLQKPPCYEFILLHIVEAQLLVKTVSPTAAYALLQKIVASTKEPLHGAVELHKELCRLSKQTQPSHVYIADLKRYTTLRWLLTKQNREAQLQALRYYLHEDDFLEVAWVDPLTNIYNRRYLDDRFPAHAPPFLAFLFDIDHFKTLNDTYGHLAGDEALQCVAQTVNHYVKALDGHFVRLGGDEFFGIFPLNDASESVHHLTTLLRTIHTLRLAHTTVTVSIGAVFYTEACPLQQILDETDKALYKAKRNGRNQFSLQTR